MPNGRDLNMQVMGETGPDIQMTVEAGGDAAAVRAEKWANGTANGVPVPASTNPNVPTSENNAKYWANQAQSAAGDATKYPKVQNNKWYVWDANTQQYADTGYYVGWHIAKTYNSIAAMNADYSGTSVAVGEYVMIVGSVETADNAKVYVKGNSSYEFVVDMSGATGIQGPIGVTPQFSIGTVTGLSHGASPTASVNNTDPTHPVLNLGIPAGASGNETIDDTAGLGDTDLVYSADKLTKELSQKASGENVYSYKSKSGSIVTVDDAVAEAVRQMRIEIAPVQDLHGYDNPWPGGENINLADFSDGYSLDTTTGLPIVYTDTQRIATLNPIMIQNGVTYKFVAFGTGTIGGIVSIFNGSTLVRRTPYISSGDTLDTSGGDRFYFCVYTGTVATLKAMILKSTDVVTEYSSFSNICPITGWTGANVTRTGKELLDTSKNVIDKAINASGQIVDVTGSVGGGNYTELIPVESGKIYYFHAIGGIYGDWTRRLHGYNKNGAWVQELGNDVNAPVGSDYSIEITIPNGISYVRISYCKSDIGATFKAENQYNITFPSGTVYGGELTINKDGSGSLVVDRACVDLGTLTWTYYTGASIPMFFATISGGKATTGTGYAYNMLCSNYKKAGNISVDANSFAAYGYGYYAQNAANVCQVLISDSAYTDAATFKAAMDGAQIVYELTTPVTYSLTPGQVITLLQGYNTVYADCGNIDILYAVRDFLTAEQADKERIHETISTPAGVQTFSDGADGVPMGIQIEVEPVQDLHGQANPWPAGGGKNKLPITVESIKQSSGRTWTDNSTTVAGITFTLLTDDSNTLIGINANGTATGEITLFIVGTGWGYDKTVKNIFDKQVTYTVEDGKGNNDPNARVELSIYHEDGTGTGKAPASNSATGNSNRTFTVLDEDNLGYLAYIRINNGTTLNNVVFKPMVTIGNAIDGTYVPYSNICPISGWTGVNIKRVKEQLYDPSSILKRKYLNPSGIITDSMAQYDDVALNLSDFFDVKEGVSYTLKAENITRSGQTVSISFCWFTGTTFIERSNSVIPLSNENYSYTATAPAGANKCRVNFATSDFDTVLIAESDSIAFSDITFPSSAGTVYGGELTINKDGSGSLMVKWKKQTGFTRGNTDSQGKLYSIGSIAETISTQSIEVSEDKSNIFTFESLEGARATRHKCLCKHLTAYYVGGYIGNESELDALLPTLELVYELATPVTYTLAPGQVKTLLGMNTIWADTGDILSVDYPADTKLYIDKKFDELSAAITALGT